MGESNAHITLIAWSNGEKNHRGGNPGFSYIYRHALDESFTQHTETIKENVFKMKTLGVCC